MLRQMSNSSATESFGGGDNYLQKGDPWLKKDGRRHVASIRGNGWELQSRSTPSLVSHVWLASTAALVAVVVAGSSPLIADCALSDIDDN